MKKFLFSLLVILFVIGGASCKSNPNTGSITADPLPQAQIASKLLYIQEPAIASVDEPEAEAEVTYTEEDLEILAIIIYQEHGGDSSSDETRIKIGNVVMNRVNDPRFGDTIKEVALAKRQWGTLYWTGIQWQDRASLPEEQAAVQRAYDCARRVLEGEKLIPDNVVFAAEFEQGEGCHEYTDGTYFCY